MINFYRPRPPFIFLMLAHWCLRESAWDGAAPFTGLEVRDFLLHAVPAQVQFESRR